MTPGHLRRRVGTYRSFLAGMIATAAHRPPLNQFNVANQGDFSVALIDAWARVCDSLSFYQERIANEGYLETAVEPLSIGHLVAAIGARRHPAIAAETHLAFRLIESANSPDRIFTDPAQPIVVQTVPDAGTLPVVFECTDRIELRGAWNAIPLARQTGIRPAQVFVGCRSIRLAGSTTGVRPGCALLLAGADPARSWLVVVNSVVVDRGAGWTVVTWTDGIPDAVDAPWPCDIVAVTLYMRPAGLFGRTAAAWTDLPAARKGAVGTRPGGIVTLNRAGGTLPAWWMPAATSEPPGALRAFVIGTDGQIVAGSDKGVFVSSDGGATWIVAALPGGRRDIQMLIHERDGRLYAGTADGAVLCSADEGATWAALPDMVVFEPEEGAARNVLRLLHIGENKPIPPWQLRAPVRTMVIAANAHGDRMVFVGTDAGVFTMPTGGLAWRPFNGGDFTGVSPESGSAEISITSLTSLEDSLVAVTDQGLFVSNLDAPQWRRVDVPIPPDARVSCLTRDSSGQTIFVGTSVGTLATPDLESEWVDLSDRGIEAGAPVHALQAIGTDIVAATEAGLLISRADAPRWRRIAVQEVALFITHLAAFDASASHINDGILRARFARAGVDLAIGSPIERLRDKQDTPVWRVHDARGSAFHLRIDTVLRVSEVLAISAAPRTVLIVGEDRLWTAVPQGDPIDREWPDFTNVQDTLILDQMIDPVGDKDEVLLVTTDTSVVDAPVRYRATGSERLLHQAFGRQAVVTRITMTPNPSFSSYDPRTTDVYSGGRELLPFTAVEPDRAPPTGRRLTLDGSGLEPGRWLQLSGPHVAVAIVRRDVVNASTDRADWFTAAPADAAPLLDQRTIAAGLKDTLRANGVLLTSTSVVTMVVAGRCWLIRDGDHAWQVDRWSDDAHDPLRVEKAVLWEVVAVPGTVDGHWTFLADDHRHVVPADQVMVAGNAPYAPLPEPRADILTIVWQAACSTQAMTAEVAQIVGEMSGGIVLAAPIGQPFDPEACRVCANVGRATHGETIAHEILGSGHMTQAAQSFTLRQWPLTWLRQPDQSIRPAITIEIDGKATKALRFGTKPGGVAGMRWQDVDRMTGTERGARAFELATDHDGREVVRFGDGAHGARLPSGRENVSATYRAGAGAVGNVPPGSLVALRKRQPGIRAVTNPIAAQGGTDAEAIDALRARAPRRLRAFDRIVTINDYRAAARDVPGVAAAAVDLVVGPGGGRTIIVTIAATPILAKVDPATLHAWVADHFAARRATQVPLVVLPPTRVTVTAVLTLDGDPGAEAEVRAQILGLGSRLGEPIDPSLIVATARSVPGVKDAALVALDTAPVAARWNDVQHRFQGASHVVIDRVTIQDKR